MHRQQQPGADRNQVQQLAQRLEIPGVSFRVERQRLSSGKGGRDRGAALCIDGCARDKPFLDQIEIQWRA